MLGGAGGIGEQICRAITALGGRVVCVDADRSSLAALAADIGVVDICADIGSEKAMAEVARCARQELASFDGFVDVVGRSDRRSLPDTDLSAWHNAFDLNLHHAFLAGQALTPILAAGGGGSVVYMSTVWSQFAMRSRPGYGPAKAALNQWVKQLAAQYGADGVRVNAVAPGFFTSKRVLEGIGAQPEMGERAARRTLLGRLGHPFEIAAAVAFLLSDAAGYITGTIVPIEGGAASRDPLGLEGT